MKVINTRLSLSYTALIILTLGVLDVALPLKKGLRDEIAFHRHVVISGNSSHADGSESTKSEVRCLLLFLDALFMSGNKNLS